MAPDANLTLGIDTDESKAVGGMLKLENAERRLDVAVKAGNQSLKLRANTEAELAKILPVIAAAEGRVVTAQQKRAAASLASQKSSALLKNMMDAEREASKKLENQERARISLAAQKSKALESELRATEKAALAAKVKAAADASRAEASVSRGVVGAAKLAAGLLGVGGAGAALALVRSELEGIDNALVASAKSANATTKGMREFVAQQQPGAEGQKFVGDVGIAGAQRGLMPDAAASIAGPIQSIADANGDGRLDGAERKAFDTDFGAAAKMAESGVASEDALKIITAGRARSQSGDVSADMMAKAAQLSAINPSTVAKSISSTSEFSNQKEALSVFNALAVEQTDVGKLPASMERLGLILGKSGEAGDTKEFSKKYGLNGLSETEKLNKLRTYADVHGKGATASDRVRDFASTLPNERGLGKETAVDLARVLRQGDTMNKAKAQLGEGSTGSLDEILAKNEASPFSGPGIVADRQAALRAMGELVGPQSAEAQKRLANRQIQGAAMIKSGDVRNIESDGSAKSFGDQTWSAWGAAMLQGAGRSASIGYGVSPGSAALADQQRSAAAAPTIDQAGVSQVQADLVAALQENNRLLAENNAVTATNNQTTKSKTPVGGARSNAEEAH